MIVVKQEVFREDIRNGGKYRLYTSNMIKLDNDQYRGLVNTILKVEKPVKLELTNSNELSSTITLDDRNMVVRQFYYCFDKEQATALTQLPKLE